MGLDGFADPYLEARTDCAWNLVEVVAAGRARAG